jgi:2'-5' RNA ligase/phage head maturation protease
MLAFFLPEEVAGKLALEPAAMMGGIRCVPPGDMHVTLAYLGDLEDEESAKAFNECKLALAKNLKAFAAKMGPVEGTLSGLIRFDNRDGGDDGQHALCASFDAPGLEDWRHELVKCVKASGLSVEPNHGFTPHCTLAYVPEDAPPVPERIGLPEPHQIAFDRFHLAWGDKRLPFQLAKPTTSQEEKKSMPTNQPPKNKQQALGTTKKTDFKLEFKTAGTSETIYEGMPGIFIEGWAAVRAPEDRYGDLIAPTSQVFQESMRTYFELNPILLYEHGLDQVIGNKPLGQVVAYRFDDDYGLWVKAFVRKPVWEPLLQIYLDIKNGVLHTFSIGGIWTRQGNEIVSADLFEISVVATPAQPYAVFDLATKSFIGADGKRIPKSKMLPLNVQRQRKALVLAIAGVNYWAEQGQRVMAAKFKSQKQKDAAMKIAAVKLEKAISYLENLTRN